MSKAKTILKWTSIALGVLLAVCAAALTGGYAWLQSESGREWLVAQIEAAVSTPGGSQLAVGKLEGDIPARMRATDVTVSDAEGAWLTLAALEIKWQPWQLLGGVLEVSSVTLTGVNLARLPATPADAEKEDAEASAGGLPSLPIGIRLHQVTADEVALGAPVLGQAARFTLAGEAQQRDDGSFSAQLDIARLDSADEHLAAQLQYDPHSDSLTADIEATAAPGGLLAGVLDLPDLPGTKLRLQGSGPLADWQGDFSLAVGEIVRADAEIGLARDRNGDLGFRLDGHSEVVPPRSEPIWDLLRGRTDISLAGAWQEEERLHLQALRTANDHLSLEMQGDVVPASGEIDLTLAASSDEAALLAGMLDLDSLSRVSAKVAVTGTINRPEADVRMDAVGISSPDFETGALSMRGQIIAKEDLLGAAPVLSLDLTGQLDRPRLPGEGDVNQLLGNELPWTLQAEIDLAASDMSVARLEASVESARVAAKGHLDLEAGTGQLDTTLSLTDVAALQPLTSVRLGGQIQLRGPVSLARLGSRVEADLEGRWAQPSSDVALIGLAAGQGMDLATHLTFEDGQLRLENTTARSQAAALQLAMTLTPGSELRDTRYALKFPSAALLSEELGADLSGPAELSGTLSGPFESLLLDGVLRLSQASIVDQALRDISGTYRLQIHDADIDGPVTLSLASPYGPLQARADFSLRADTVTLAALQASLPGTEVTGEVTAPLAGGDPVVALQGDIDDLRPWLQVAEMDGSGHGSITLQLNRPDQSTPVLASAELSTVTLRTAAGAIPIQAERITLDMEAQDPALAKAGKFALRAQGLTRDQLALDSLALDGTGTLQDLSFDLSTKGQWSDPLELTAAGNLQQTGETLQVTLDSAEGSAFGQPLRLRQTARLTLAPGATRLENLDIVSGDAELTATARLGGEEVMLMAALDRLPMKTVNAFWDSGLSGVVSAELSLDGRVENPRGTAHLSATGLRPPGSKDLPPLELTADADWRAGRAKVEGQLVGPRVTAARFAVEGPLEMTADGGVQMPADGALAGQVNWSGNIATLLLFVPLAQHRLAGDGAIDLTLGGTVAQPAMDGSITLSKGRYENLEMGTVLRDLSLTAKVAEDKVTLANLSASDGAKGKVTGQGELSIDPDNHFPFDVGIDLTSFRAVHRDDVTALIGGTVKLDGDMNSPRVEGRFTTQTVEVNIATGLPPSVASLDVIEVRDGVVQEQPQQQAPAAVEAALDVVVEMPSRVFVRGRGLDSEWAGRISVQGSSANPRISGNVDLVRGQLSLVGKTFRLEKGKVTLPASANSEPTLDVTAVHEGQQLKVTAHMTGPVSRPELELTSNPEVPRDEIISRVLFNKSAANLTPAEAAQLAIAVRDLTGGGGGTDILGFARRTMGVDVLRVDTTEEGRAAVEAGRYLTDDVYLGVKQGADPNSSSAGVEIELTPNITVESEVTGKGANKSGVRFQLDY